MLKSSYKKLLLFLTVLIWLSGLTLFLFIFLHPYRTEVNSDDAFAILECSYHSVARDGFFMWGRTIHSADSIILSNFLLEKIGLKNIISHCSFYVGLQIVILLVGATLIGKKFRTFLFTAPIIVILISHSSPLNTLNFSFWVCKSGVPVPEYVFMAFLTFTSLILLAKKEKKWWPALLFCSFAFLLSIASSPGNLVLISVWIGLCFVYDLPDFKKKWLKWLLTAALLGGVYFFVNISRDWYDHAIHIHRHNIPVELNWQKWWETIATFIKQFKHYGIFHTSIMVLGIIIGITGAVIYGLSLFFPRRKRFARNKDLFLHHAFMLSIAGIFFTVLLAANTWVQINPINQTYILPVFFLFLGAIVCLISPLLQKINAVAFYTIVIFLLCFAGYQTYKNRPVKLSKHYLKAHQLLKYTNDFDGTIPLIGDYWISTVNSFFDSHKIVATSFDNMWLADTMAEKVLKHPRVLVNFTYNKKKYFINGQPPQTFFQKEFLLTRDKDIPELARQGWHTYKTIDTKAMIAGIKGPNLIGNIPAKPLGSVNVLSNSLVIQATEKSASELHWALGKLPPGWYALAFSARAIEKPKNNGWFVFHLADLQIDPLNLRVAIKANQLTKNFQEFNQLIYYPGCNKKGVPTRARAYTTIKTPVEINFFGIYKVNIK